MKVSDLCIEQLYEKLPEFQKSATTIYIEMLKQWVKLDICIQYLEFLEETHGKEVVLLCYEKADDFCHRQLLVNYIKNVYDNDILEL